MKLLRQQTVERHTRLHIVLLSGALRPSPLRQRLDIPVLCLPLTPSRTLLDFWLSAIDGAPGANSVTIVVNSQTDAARLSHELALRRAGQDGERGRLASQVEVVVDPAPWRGAGGLIYDIVSQSHHGWLSDKGDGAGHRLNSGAADGAGVVIVAEAACVPPDSLESLLSAIEPGDRGARFAGVSGISENDEPAGLYAFTEEAIRLIPPVGYFDIKEQLLPALYARGRPVPAMPVTDRTLRLWDRESYLNAVRAVQSEAHECGRLEGGRRTQYDCSGGGGFGEGVTIARGARVAPPCLIGPRVAIGAGAIVHASVLMEGAVVGAGAVVSRSVIGPGGTLPDGAVVRSEVIAAASTAETKKRSARRPAARRLPLAWLMDGRGDR